MKKRFEALENFLIEKEGNLYTAAGRLCLTYQGLKNKLTEKNAFTLREVDAIRKMYNLTDDELLDLFF